MVSSTGAHKQLYHSMNSANELMNGTDRSTAVAQQGSTGSAAQNAPDKNTAGGPAVETNPQFAISTVEVDVALVRKRVLCVGDLMSMQNQP